MEPDYTIAQLQVVPHHGFSNLNNFAHVIQTADDGRMHALVLDKVTHRIIASHGQAGLLVVEAVDQIED
jgi:hypothetical protein